ncbi:MAG: LysR family transcriptional regulator [Acetobacteraceae bacterium]
MELRQVQHFLAAAHHGSLRRAAETAGVSQPALTKSIRRLETSLSVTLFERSPRGIRLTSFGEALLPHARALEIESRLAEETIRNMRSTAHGRVKVGAGPSMSISLLPMVTERLMHGGEDVRIEVHAGLNDTLLEALREGRIDFAITTLPSGSAVSEAIAQERLFTDRVVIIGRNRHALSGRSVDAKELLACSWLLPHRSVVTRLRLDEFFVRRGLGQPAVWAETDSIPFILETVGRTNLLSYAPALLLAGHALTAIKVAGSVWRRTVGLSYWRNRTMTRASTRFLTVLRDVAHELHGA